MVVSNDNVYINLNYSRQAPPYNLMLPMDNRYHVAKKLGIGTNGALLANTSYPFETAMGRVPGGILQQARNLSYNRLVQGLGDSSSFGATLTAERRETFSMLLTIVGRATSAARNIKKLNLAAAARDLGLPYRERTRYRKYRVRIAGRQACHRTVRIKETYFDWNTGRWRLKTAASGWLMYSYGIKPLMADCYNTVDLLQREFPTKRLSGSAYQTGRNHSPFSGYPGAGTTYVASVSVRQSASFRVRNPNLWRANQLGLVNPAEWVLEAIPFSFVIDWFSNLSDVVGSFTDFTGLEVLDPCVNYMGLLNEDSVFPATSARYVRNSRYTRRELALALPKLVFKYERFGWQRGANAISLLVGFLRNR